MLSSSTHKYHVQMSINTILPYQYNKIYKFSKSFNKFYPLLCIFQHEMLKIKLPFNFNKINELDITNRMLNCV